MALPIKYNLRNLVVRKGSTLATAFTIGLTVAVFLMVMALARGIDLTLSSSGEPLNVIVLREGSTAELNSSVSREQYNDLMYLDGVVREGDRPLATAEIITLIYKPRKGQSQGSNVQIRGVGPMSFKLRSGFQTVAGRLFQPGMTEAVVLRRPARHCFRCVKGTRCFHLFHHGGGRGLRGYEYDVRGGRATYERD